MKKFLSIFTILISCFILVGCGCEKEKEKEKSKVDVSDEISSKLFTDDTKLVYDNNGNYTIVLYYTNNEITGLEHYYKYSSEEIAKEKYEAYKTELKNNITIKDIELVGKYVIFTINESEYEGKTVESAKKSYSYLVPVYKK